MVRFSLIYHLVVVPYAYNMCIFDIKLKLVLLCLENFFFKNRRLEAAAQLGSPNFHQIFKLNQRNRQIPIGSFNLSDISFLSQRRRGVTIRNVYTIFKLQHEHWIFNQKTHKFLHSYFSNNYTNTKKHRTKTKMIGVMNIETRNTNTKKQQLPIRFCAFFFKQTKMGAEAFSFPKMYQNYWNWLKLIEKRSFRKR